MTFSVKPFSPGLACLGAEDASSEGSGGSAGTGGACFGVEQEPARILESLMRFSVCQAPHWVPALPAPLLPGSRPRAHAPPFLSFLKPGPAASLIFCQLPLPWAPDILGNGADHCQT